MLLFDFVMVTLVTVALALLGIVGFTLLTVYLEKRRPVPARVDCRETVMIQRGERGNDCD